MVVERPDTPEGKLAVLCVGGAMVNAERDDLTVVDRAFDLPPGPDGRVRLAGVVTAVDAVVDLVSDSNSGSGSGSGSDKVCGGRQGRAIHSPGCGA